MKYEISPLSGDACRRVDYINQSSAAPLTYYSSGYLSFLCSLMPTMRLHLIFARDGDCEVGYLPLAEQTYNGASVFNSLPFYGSHGGPSVLAHIAQRENVKAGLLATAADFARESDALSLTIVENPLDPISEISVKLADLEVIDDRIGQFTSLPKNRVGIDDLLARFHQKTRNAVRKGVRSGQVVHEESDLTSLKWLQNEHAAGIERLAGKPKSVTVFENLVEYFPLGNSSRLFIGYIDRKPVSGLLVLLFGRTVEYFTPVATEDYRNEQVLSSLIAEVMQRLVAEGYEEWNWGGTWRSQEGVYRFKNRFGATDYPYRYFGKIFDMQRLLRIKAEDASAFPYFYLYRY